MTSPKNDELSIDSMIKASIRKTLKKHLPQSEKISLDIDKQVANEIVSEAYVAEPKPFGQVTEFLTQKTKDAHEKLYKGYVETLNRVSAELDSADRTEVNSQHCDFRSLKLDETYNLNATWLHELYFANCFDPHSEIYMDSLTYLRLERDFGAFEDWQKDFMACALSSGEGWAVCGYHMFLKRFINMIVSNHSNDVLVGLYPVIVVDMWSHAYYKDYMTDKKSYLVSQMREFNWRVIEERMQRVEAISGALR